MQLYYPAKPYLRNIPAHFLRGEKARIGWDWSGIGNVLTSSWLNQNVYTSLSSAALSGNVATVYVEMTGVGTELLQNTVTLDTGEAIRVWFEVTVRPAQETEFPDPSCPVLLTPANGSTGSLLTSQAVTWAAAPFATSYNVYLDGELVATTGDTSYNFTGLTPSTSYTWSIVPDGVESCGSRTFNTPAVQCPGITVPTNGSSVGNVTSTTLLWPAVAEAVSYDVYVWLDGNPQPGTPTANVLVNTYEATGLSSATTYRVVINTVTAGGHVSQGCASTTFVTDAAPAVVEWQSATFTGDILGASVTLVAVRSGNTGTTASADYAFTEGTALIGPDFTATPGTVTFDPAEVTQNVVVPLVRDYNAEVLAGLPLAAPTIFPTAFWDFSEAASATVFNDLTANGLDLNLSNTANWTYDQPDINLSVDGTVRRTTGGGNFLNRVNINSLIDNGYSFTVGMWVKFDVAAATTRTLFHIGGAGGSGQFTYCWCVRGTTGKATMYWHHHTSSGNTFLTRTFTLDLPEDQEMWIEAGFDYSNTRAFFRINDGTAEYISWTAADSPNALDHTAGRQTYIGIAGRLISSSPSPIGGYFGQVEFYVANSAAGYVSPSRYPRWNLNAALTFTSTLSNPNVGTNLGAVNPTTMTIEAP